MVLLYARLNNQVRGKQIIFMRVTNIVIIVEGDRYKLVLIDQLTVTLQY